MKMKLKRKTYLTLTLISGIIFILVARSFAQPLKLTSYFEHTHVSPKIGTSAGYIFGCSFEIGGFYQQEINPGFYERISRKREEEFFGAYIAIPMLCKNHFNLDFQVRTGIVNREYFAITPSIHFTYRPVRFLGISAGMGVRNFRPTVIPRIEIII
jgi:hypothetical protein